MQKPLNEPVKYDADTTSVFFPGPEAHGPAELGEVFAVEDVAWTAEYFGVAPGGTSPCLPGSFSLHPPRRSDASTIRTLGAMQRDEVKGNVILSTTKLRSFFIVVK